jgi:hypothetical protein
MVKYIKLILIKTAYCNKINIDLKGTPPAIYFREGVGDGKDKILI